MLTFERIHQVCKQYMTGYDTGIIFITLILFKLLNFHHKIPNLIALLQVTQGFRDLHHLHHLLNHHWLWLLTADDLKSESSSVVGEVDDLHLTPVASQVDVGSALACPNIIMLMMGLEMSQVISWLSVLHILFVYISLSLEL